MPDGKPADDPDAWDPEDALFVALRDQHGNLLGILSVDEPVSGLRPTDDELDVLVSLADHGALALEAGKEAAASARHQRALEELLAVSSRITGETSNAEILRRVCTGIRDALDFENVCAALVDPQSGAVVPQAAAGWQLQELWLGQHAVGIEVDAWAAHWFRRGSAARPGRSGDQRYG